MQKKRYPHLCGQCSRGYSPGTIKTFTPECPGCQKKKKDGLRTGNEPLPDNQAHKFGRVRKQVDWDKKKRSAALAKKRADKQLEEMFNRS